MLLIGWAGALRRSEIGALDVDDVTFAPEGAIVNLRRSKTDQIGSGARIPIPRASTPEVCPFARSPRGLRRRSSRTDRSSVRSIGTDTLAVVYPAAQSQASSKRERPARTSAATRYDPASRQAPPEAVTQRP